MSKQRWYDRRTGVGPAYEFDSVVHAALLVAKSDKKYVNFKVDADDYDIRLNCSNTYDTDADLVWKGETLRQGEWAEFDNIAENLLIVEKQISKLNINLWT